MAQAILELHDFKVTIGHKKVLRSVNLKVPEKGITAIMGPSGTGKSTLLRALASLGQDNVQLQIAGQVTLNLPEGKSPKLALVAQQMSQVLETVKEILLSNLPQRAELERDEQMYRLESMCRQKGQDWVLQKLEVSLVNLTLYEQRMVFILREMLAHPALLMLDEPTANLDDMSAQKKLVFLHKIALHMPILMVSHHLAQTRKCAQYVALIANGRVEQFADVDTFFSQPATPLVAQYLRTGSCAELSAEELDALEQQEKANHELNMTVMSMGKETVKHRQENASSTSLEDEKLSARGRPAIAAKKIATAVDSAISTDEAPVSASGNNIREIQFSPTTERVVAEKPNGVQVAFSHWGPQIKADAHAKNAMMGPEGFVWLIKGRMAGMPYPGIVGDVNTDLGLLKEMGVTHLVSLTQKMFPQELAAPFSMTVSHFPIVDMLVPTLSAAVQFCQDIDKRLSRQEVVAIHCRAGLGRTGTMLAVYYLWQHQGRKIAAEAIQYIRRLNWAMIQSREQTDFLDELAQEFSRHAYRVTL